jgi:hypothetical protein
MPGKLRTRGGSECGIRTLVDFECEKETAGARREQDRSASKSASARNSRYRKNN